MMMMMMMMMTTCGLSQVAVYSCVPVQLCRECLFESIQMTRRATVHFDAFCEVPSYSAAGSFYRPSAV